MERKDTITTMIHKLFLGILFLTLSACQASSQKLDVYQFENGFKNSDQALLLDVRTTEEFSEGHIPGAININYYDADFFARFWNIEKSKPLYIYCHSGKRSAEAAELLRREGFKNVYELQGGITAWKDARKEIIK